MLTATLSPAVRTMAEKAHVGDGVAVVQILDGSGPKDVHDALKARTGSHAWSIIGLRDGYARFVAA